MKILIVNEMEENLYLLFLKILKEVIEENKKGGLIAPKEPLLLPGR